MNNEIGLILGRKGTGKSSLARALINDKDRNIILDTFGDDYNLGGITSDVQHCAEYYNRVNGNNSFAIVFRPTNDSDCEAFFRFAKETRAVTIWIDEVDRYCGPHSINEDLKWMLNYGRHRAISTIGIARRAASVHRDFTANADWIAVHQTRENRDLQYLREFMNTEGLETLEQFQFKFTGTSANTNWSKLGIEL